MGGLPESGAPSLNAGSAALRPRLALAGTLLLGVGLAASWLWFADAPLVVQRSPGHASTRAAVALRDNVIPFQKYGTKLFTLPSLEAAYDRVYYLTDEGRGGAREALLETVTGALSSHAEVDLFLLAHQNGMVAWVAELPPNLRRHLRLVYNTGCGDANQAERWHALGARAYVGHAAPGATSPVFYYFFLRRWVRGWELSAAVSEANQQSRLRMGWFGIETSELSATATLSGRGDLWVGSP